MAEEDVRRTVEFYKDCKGIDEAVDHVVYYCEPGRQPKTNDEKCGHYSWQTEVDYSHKGDSSSDEDSLSSRVSDKPKRGQNWQTKKQKLGNASKMQSSHPPQQVLTQVETDQAKQI